MFIAAETIGQLEKDLKQAREDRRYAESQEQAGHRVLSRSIEDTNKLKAKKEQQAREIEKLKAQLAAAKEKNQKTNTTISGKHAQPLNG
jgi:hypothetical protein